MAELIELIKEFRGLAQELYLLRKEITRLHPLYARWVSVAKVDETIDPLKEVEVLRYEGAGYFGYALLRSNNAELMFKLDLYSDGVVEIAESPKSLYEKGFTQSIGGIRVLKYSDTEKDYVIEYPPVCFSGTGIPFRGYLTLRLWNPTKTSIKYTLYLWYQELPW